MQLAPSNSVTLAQAHEVASNPQAHHSPTQRLLAWAMLKTQRGQTLRQQRLRLWASAHPQEPFNDPS